MKILLFGGSGQLGRECRKRGDAFELEILSPVSDEVDIANASQIARLVETIKPNCIVNCAAYTAVDKAEAEPERAFAVNAEGPRLLARAARSVGARLLHVSTDYVFSGEVETDLGERRPYREDDPTRPLSVYGKSKLAGEQACEEEWAEGSLIIRTSSLFGGSGPNFILTMLELFGRYQNVKVVGDQYMSPTWAGWLAEVLLKLVRKDVVGVLHASCSGGISWYDFAQGIFQQASKSKDLPANLLPTTMAEYQRPAPRPRYSVMDCSRLEAVLGEKVVGWSEALECYLAEHLSG